MKLARRLFFQLSAVGLLGAVGCQNKGSSATDSRLAFAGELRGEKFAVGHQFRDGLLGSLDEVEVDSTKYDFIIAGGGISGLSLAYKLKKLGLTKGLVLDKEQVAGGLCRGETSPQGISYGIGAHYLDYPQPGNEPLIELLTDCGVIAGQHASGWPMVRRQFVLNPDPNNIFVDGKWYPSDIPEPLCTDDDDRQWEQFTALVGELSAWVDEEGKPAFGHPLRKCSGQPKMIELDRLSLSKWLYSHQLDSKILHWYCNLWMIDEYGSTAETTSAWAGLHFFRDRMPPADLYHSSISFPEGLGFLTRWIVNELNRGQIRTNLWVVQVQDEGDRVQIVCFDDAQNKYLKLQCRRLVLAVPKHQIPYLIPQLPNQRRKLYSDFHYVPWVVANVHLRSLPDYGTAEIRWDNMIYDSWTLGYINNQFMASNPTNSNQPHVWSLYACFPENATISRNQMLQRSWDTWARMFLKELEVAHPEIGRLIERLDIWLWGHPMRPPYVGSIWHGNRHSLNEPIGNISFCHVDSCGIPVAEEAIDQAFQHAQWLAEQLT